MSYLYGVALFERSLELHAGGARATARKGHSTSRERYGGDKFDKWFNRKSDEPAYVCVDGHRLVAFLYLKTEGRDEAYADIDPPFAAKQFERILELAKTDPRAPVN